MKSRLKGLQFALAAGAALWMATSPAMAVTITNTGTGNIAGQSGTLSSGNVSLDVQSLHITKLVYDLTNTKLADSDNAVSNNKVAKGQTVWVVLYVDNSSNATVQDVRVKDNLGDANGDGSLVSSGLSYVANSLEYLTSDVASASASGTSSTSPGWFHTGTWLGKTDTYSSADELGVASGSGPTAVLTLGGTTGENLAVNLQPLKITAFRFKVTIN